jgi:dGTPase
VCHDFEDAVASGVVSPEQLPAEVAGLCGTTRREQLGAFIRGMINAAATTGRIGMTDDTAQALAAFRRFNYDRIYLRPESRQQADAVISLLRALVEHFAAHPQQMSHSPEVQAGSAAAVHAAVAYVGGMTDRYACRQGIALLDWPVEQLPKGIDTPV